MFKKIFESNMDSDYFRYSCDNMEYSGDFNNYQVPLIFFTNIPEDINYYFYKFNPSLLSIINVLDICFKKGQKFNNLNTFKIYEDYFNNENNKVEDRIRFALNILENTENIDLKKYIINNYDITSLKSVGYYIDDILIYNHSLYPDNIKKDFFPEINLLKFLNGLNKSELDEKFDFFVNYLKYNKHYYKIKDIQKFIYHIIHKEDKEKIIKRINILKENNILDIGILKECIIEDKVNFKNSNQYNYKDIIEKIFQNDFIESYDSFPILMQVIFINDIILKKGIQSIFKKDETDQSLFKIYMNNNLDADPDFENVLDNILSYEIDDYIQEVEFRIILRKQEMAHFCIKNGIIKITKERLEAINEFCSNFNKENYEKLLIKTISDFEKKSIGKHLFKETNSDKFKKRL